MRSNVRVVCFFLFLLPSISVSAQSASIGEARMEIEGDRATVSASLSKEAATSFLANQVPAKQDSDVDANGESLAIEYDARAKVYVVEESTFTNVRDVRRYVREWLREVLEVGG